MITISEPQNECVLFPDLLLSVFFIKYRVEKVFQMMTSVLECDKNWGVRCEIKPFCEFEMAFSMFVNYKMYSGESLTSLQ